MKSAVVYDWLMARGGGELSLEAILQANPSPLYALFSDPDVWKEEVHTSWLQHLPFLKGCYRNYFPLFPLGIEQFDLSEYDLVLSISHCVAKGVLTREHQLHLCYCFSPARYAWDLTHQYLGTLGPLRRALARPFLHRLRNWDIATLNRVDHFATVSRYIARRIQKVYGRESRVIYPPVDVERIAYSERKEEYYLTVSRLVPYKRVDLIVEAFSHFPDKRLVVVGEGPEKIRGGKNVEMLGFVPEARLQELRKRAKGFVFAAEEDFGIAVVEAEAAGTPVIALGRGGSLETVVEGKTGIFFQEPSVASLCDAVVAFEKKDFDPQAIAHHAKQFGKERFIQEWKRWVEDKYEIHSLSRR